MRKTSIILLTLISILASSSSLAQITARAELSDIGVGAEIGYRHDSRWGVRLGYVRGDVDADINAEDNNGFKGDELQYDSNVDLDNTYLVADFHPTNGHFRLSAGSFYNRSSAKITTRCNATSPVPGAATCEFGNSVFAPSVLGEIITDIDFNSLAPYVGIGWGHKPKIGFAFNVDLGVIYVGSANVDMRSTGTCNSSTQCRAQIDSEEKELQDELQDYRWLPYASAGVSYRF